MWIELALISSLCLGTYDIFKKLSLKNNNVLMVLFLNTVFGVLFLSPILIQDLIHGHCGLGSGIIVHLQILLKAVIVLGSWVLGYFAIKHLPLTIQGPINATRPVLVLVGALCIYGEKLNLIQWIGILLGFASLYFISRIGAKEGFVFKRSKWLWMSIGAMSLGAISALYDKYLLKTLSPLEVQAWYSLYQCIIMGGIVGVFTLNHVGRTDKFKWKWTIPCIALFLTIADMAYFYSLSMEDAMVSIISMIRRGSVIVSFLYGVIALHEKNIRAKALDLCILLISLGLLVWGSYLK